MWGDRIELAGAELYWSPQFLTDPARWLEQLLVELPWQQRSIRMFGRDLPEPRLTSWHGDPGASYRYSGQTNEPLPWTPVLQRMRQRLAEIGVPSNSVLANLYRDGADHMGWHADDERGLGPVIASVSLGSARTMQFRPRPKGPVALRIELLSGSLLVMAGATQRNVHHRIPATRTQVGPRVNLTFRTITS